MRIKKFVAATSLALGMGFMAQAPVHAGGFPVIDIANVIQGVQQVLQAINQIKELQNQFAKMQEQLEQAEDQYRAITGLRGMESIISNPFLLDLAVDAQAILDWLNEWDVYLKDADYFEQTYPDQPGLTQEDKEIFEGHLQHISEWAVEAGQLIQMAQSRIPELNRLITVGLPAAHDQKAVLDLIARISAENALLLNELIIAVAQQSQRMARDRMTEQQATQAVLEFARSPLTPLP